MTKFIILLVIFHFKHLLADYPLQTPYMLGKFKGGWDWVKPLAAHSAVHALFTFAISIGALWNVTGPVSLFMPFALAILDFSIHGTMDRIKASPNLLGRYKALSAAEYPSIKRTADYEGSNGECLSAKRFCEQKLKSNTYFWWALGLDQMVHGLTDLLIAAILVGAL